MLEKEEKYDFFEITNSKHPALYAPESPVCKQRPSQQQRDNYVLFYADM